MESNILRGAGSRAINIAQLDKIDEDVGRCEYGYFRCLVSFWRVLYGWVGLWLFLTLSASTFMQGASTFGLLQESKERIEIASFVLTGVATFLTAFKDYSLKVIAERKAQLQEIRNDMIITNEGGKVISANPTVASHNEPTPSKIESGVL